MRRDFTLLLMIVFISIVSNANGQFAGGSGSEADPWQVSTIDQLDSVRLYPDSSFELINDLDFSGSSYDSLHSGSGWEPIGDNLESANRFTGAFNGKGHTISNLFIRRTGMTYVGLFGFVQDAVIDSVSLESCYVHGNNDVGGLAGIVIETTVSNSSVTGYVIGGTSVGGLLGIAHQGATVTNCEASVQISGTTAVGGAMGGLYKVAVISDCESSSSVSGTKSVGGFAGTSDSSRVVSSHASGSVTGQNYVGGLIGWQYTYSSLYNSYATGQVSGDTLVGGLVGVAQNLATIDTCYASGTVGGVMNVGGLVGTSVESSISESYASGQVTGQENVGGFIGNSTGSEISDSHATNPVTGNKLTGGFIGRCYSSTEISDSYAAGEVTGLNYTGGFSGVVYDGTLSSCYSMGAVRGDTIVGGLVGELTDSEVTTCSNKGNVNADAIVGGLVGASGNSSISDSYVTGNTSGTENIIGGLVGITNSGTTLSGSYVTGNVTGLINTGGLVGQMGESVTLAYCASYGNVTGTENVGGLVGIDYSSAISNSFTSGYVTGNARVGGVVGIVDTGSEITDCYSIADVTANENVGGLAGWIYSGSPVTTCYSSGKISGTTNVGGFIGKNDSDEIENSFYDQQSSGVDVGIGQDSESQSIGGLTTSQMKVQSNFSGFDFTNNWSISAEQTYPVLQGVNNAPFAYADTVQGRINDLYTDNYDYETAQANLVYQMDSIISVETGTDEINNHASFEFGDSLLVSYQIGEYSIDLVDTLWGNRVTSLLIYGNHAPDITSIASDTVIGGSDYSYTVLVTDEDDDDLTYILSDQPDGMTVDAEGAISWTPGSGILTSGEVTLTVSDGDLTDVEVFTITVNYLPVISSLAPDSVIAGNEFSYAIAATDVNGDDLSYELLNAPDGMVLTDTVIAWTPAIGVITSGEVTVTVSDGYLQTTEIFTVTVQNAPVISSVASTSVVAAEQYVYRVIATDANGDELGYELSGAPEGMILTDTVITWTPAVGVIASGEITLTVSDGELTDTETFSVTVYNAPIITSTAPTAVAIGSEYQYEVTASDANGDTLTFTLSDQPEGMVLTDTIITWTPAEGVTTSGEVTLIVSDGELTATETFTVSVKNPPVISSTAPVNATVGVTYIYAVSASDVDSEELTYSLSNEPEGMILTDTVITWTPAGGVLTSGEVTLMVSDGELSDTETFIISVNNAPSITSTAPTAASIGSMYKYEVVATDPNGDALTYLLSNEPDGMTITDSTITWTPSEGTTTSGEILLTVSDGELTVSETFVITIKEAPIITSVAPTTATAGQQYTYAIAASDPDSETLTYHLSNAPEGMLIVDTVVTWIPDVGIVTSGEVTITVSDGELEDTETFTILVNNAPVITSTAPTAATVGSVYNYTIVATDANEDDLSFSLANEPEGMEVEENGVITWTPVAGTTTSGEVTLTVSDGQLSDSELFTITVSEIILGLDDVKVELYPNPTTDFITISNTSGADLLQLISSTGVVITSVRLTNIDEYQLNLSDLAVGVYFVQVKVGEKLLTQRLLKR